MNIVKRVFKLICICIFCIPIVACGRISRFEWNEVEYNKIAICAEQPAGYTCEKWTRYNVCPF